MTMNDALKDALIRKGWEPTAVLWGQRISGSPHGCTIKLPDDREQYFPGPFTAIQGGDQIAIVRWG